MKIGNNFKLWRSIFLLLFLSFNFFGNAHPFYVSIGEISYNAEAKCLEISLRIFTDNIETSLSNISKQKIYLGEKNEITIADSLLRNYILDNFQIEYDQKSASIEFLGKEVEGELCWVYLVANNIPDFEYIKIINRILYQDFPEQANLVHVTHRSDSKSLLLNKNKPSDQLSW